MDKKIEVLEAYIRFPDMTWPRAEGDRFYSAAWAIRYGEPTQEQKYQIASIVQAYSHLINMTQKDRNKICKVLKEPK